MATSRLEVFSDGVLAIIITIMVLELKVPAGDTMRALWDATGVGFLSRSWTLVSGSCRSWPWP